MEGYEREESLPTSHQGKLCATQDSVDIKVRHHEPQIDLNGSAGALCSRIKSCVIIDYARRIEGCIEISEFNAEYP